MLRNHSASLTPTCSLTTLLPDRAQVIFRLMQTTPRTPEQTRFAFSSIMTAPERVDYRDRAVQPFEPPHRLGFLEWRRRGVLLPYGASQDHFTVSNRWLFTEKGELAFKDSSAPLCDWE